MATAEVNPRAFVLPPGAANVEDDVKAWEAQERRAKWKLMIVRVLLAIALLSLWEYGTDRWFDALWFSSPLRIAHHFVKWAQDDLFSHLVITLRETFIGYACGTLLGIATGTLAGALSVPRQGARSVHPGAQWHPAYRTRAIVHHLVRDRRALEDRARRAAGVLSLLLRDAVRAP